MRGQPRGLEGSAPRRESTRLSVPDSLHSLARGVRLACLRTEIDRRTRPLNRINRERSTIPLAATVTVLDRTLLTVGAVSEVCEIVGGE